MRGRRREKKAAAPDSISYDHLALLTEEELKQQLAEWPEMTKSASEIFYKHVNAARLRHKLSAAAAPQAVPPTPVAPAAAAAQQGAPPLPVGPVAAAAAAADNDVPIHGPAVDPDPTPAAADNNFPDHGPAVDPATLIYEDEFDLIDQPK